MHAIVAIGGGEVGENIVVDRHSLELTGKDEPNLLVVASSDDTPGAAELSAEYYANLGASSRVLDLSTTPEQSRVHAEVLGADLIIGSLHTLTEAVAEWRQYRIDRLLAITRKRPALQILSFTGEAAGLPFEFAASTQGTDEHHVGVLTGIDLLHNTLVIPYYSSEREVRSKFVKDKLPLPNRRGEATANAYALDDGAAIVIHSQEDKLPYAITTTTDHVRFISPRRGEPHQVIELGDDQELEPHEITPKDDSSEASSITTV